MVLSGFTKIPSKLQFSVLSKIKKKPFSTMIGAKKTSWILKKDNIYEIFKVLFQISYSRFLSLCSKKLLIRNRKHHFPIFSFSEKKWNNNGINLAKSNISQSACPLGKTEIHVILSMRDSLLPFPYEKELFLFLKLVQNHHVGILGGRLPSRRVMYGPQHPVWSFCSNKGDDWDSNYCSFIRAVSLHSVTYFCVIMYCLPNWVYYSIYFKLSHKVCGSLSQGLRPKQMHKQ